MHALALVLVLSTAQVDLPMPPPPTPRSKASTAKPKPKPATATPAAEPAPAPVAESAPAKPEPRPEPVASAQQGRRLPPIDLGLTIGPMMVVSSRMQSGAPPFFRLGVRANLKLLQLDRVELGAGLGFGLSGAAGSIRVLSQNIPFSSTMFDFYPSGRAALTVTKDLSLYGELGLLIGYQAVTIQQMYVGNVTQSGGGAGLRLGLGLEWRINPSISLIFEPMGLSVFSASYSANGTTQSATSTLWGLFVGGSFRL